MILQVAVGAAIFSRLPLALAVSLYTAMSE
ncbi:hypothetical protein BN11_2370002 [Nostocoides australiense Ben110]|uniref:Uncharacterized protein n=1 Tax=Nostocoides australiense Ben110 TaxID=1193182 RepID=W6JWY0_9MICO|nr:hypothetical protein BN11_2370002 [Tetrasphaera australiensis Ben110]